MMTFRNAALGVFVSMGTLTAFSMSAVAQTTAATPPAAPNPCTGIAESACPTVAGCVWLPGYKVKGGTDMLGYCRTAPKPLTSRKPGDPAAAPK
jgi:hypothetical protein